MKELRLLALNGFLGYGYREESLRNGLNMQPHYICADAGSTDPGPSYLGSGKQLVSPSQVYRDLALALPPALTAGIPMIIGSAGTAGSEVHLQDFLETLKRAASDLGLRFNSAVIRSDIERELVLKALGEQRIRPMPGVPELTADAAAGAVRIVGQMGTEPIIRALKTRAEFIAAGRACDTALFAAPAIMHGFDPGLAIHMGKILECGALCAVPAGANDCLMGILREDHFLIHSVNPDRKVTVDSVAAHSLYEQSDPTNIVEPEGVVDLTGARFSQVDSHTVRVWGSSFTPAPDGLSIKLEGASETGYRVFTIAGIRDPLVIAHLDEIEANVRRSVAEHLNSEYVREGYTLTFRYYGRDGVLGDLEPETFTRNPASLTRLSRGAPPYETGLLIEATAPREEASKAILALARSSFLHGHFPGRKTTAGNLAFPFSPSDIAAGPVYTFSVYHLLSGESSETLFPVDIMTIP